MFLGEKDFQQTFLIKKFIGKKFKTKKINIKVNNDTVNRQFAGEPGVNKMEISTKLLIADGDIVVIGGIKKNKVFNTTNQTPGIGNIPILGNLFKGKTKSDSMDELLIFIAPRIL